MKAFFLTVLGYLLFPLTFFYRFLFAMDRLRKTPKKIPNAIVLSIGNLSVGGTGKTPFTMHLLHILEETGLPLCVLSRGYGGSFSKQGMKVESNTPAKDCGDEPALIKKIFPNVEVIIGRDRWTAFHTYSNQKDTKKIILLDDGFQHHSLYRDLDFVLIDSQKLLGNGWTLPAGLLRESKSALKRAHIVVFTKYETIYKESVDKLEENLSREFPHLKFFKMYFTPIYLKNRDGEILNLDQMTDLSVLAFSGVGNFSSFENTILSLNSKSTDFIQFADHFPFSESHIQELLRKAKDKILLCTSKDFVKFQPWIHNHSEYKNLWYLEMNTSLDKKDLEVLEILQTFFNSNSSNFF